MTKTARPVRVYTPRDVLDALGVPPHVRQGRLIVFAMTAREAADRLEELGPEPPGTASHLKLATDNDSRALATAGHGWRGTVYALPMNGSEVAILTGPGALCGPELVGRIDQAAGSARFVPSRRSTTNAFTTNYVQAATTAFNNACPDEPPELVQLYVLLVLVKGTETTLEDAHNAWSVWHNTTNLAHKSLILFDQLSPEVQEMDRKYTDAIHAATWAVKA